jgi:hypothetical protein
MSMSENRFQITSSIYKYTVIGLNLALNPDSFAAGMASLKQAVRLFLFPLKKGFPLEVWPERTYIISHQYKYIYCPITKVVLSYFKNLIIKTSNFDENREIEQYQSIHHFALDKLSLSQYSPEVARKFLGDSTYFKFTFIRNSAERLVSAYLDKFVGMQDRLDSFAKNVINQIYRRRGEKVDLEKSISFREFVSYLSVTKNDKLNEHWRPQYLHLGAVKFDFIGRLENEADFEYLKHRLSLNINIKSQSKASTKQSSGESLADLHPWQIQELGGYPNFNYRDFITPDLLQVIHQRYILDFKLFGGTTRKSWLW